MVRLGFFLAGIMFALSLCANPISAPQLLQLVDYVGVDYEEAVNKKGHIHNRSEYAEMQEFSATIVGAVKALPESEQKAGLVIQAEKLQRLVTEAAPPNAVHTQTQALTEGLRGVLAVSLTPTHAPNVALGKRLYESNCVSCHGEKGAGDGVLARTLTPAPTNFLDKHRMDQLSVFAIYNTITLGVAGTGMASYAQALSDDERWSLAFYVSGLSASPKAIARGKASWKASAHEWVPDLEALTTLTAHQIAQHGSKADDQLHYLRAHPAVLFEANPWDVTLTKLAASVKSYEAHDAKAAYQYALSAYLDGFETAEAVLDVLDRDKRLLIEKKMMAFRTGIKTSLPIETINGMHQELIHLLQDVQKTLPTTEFSNPAVFLSALVILLREGLESILIVGMLLMMLIKGERRELLPAVHAGWLSAVVAGALTWWGSHTLISISGATREITEGVTALIAAGMLLYVGIWIHRHQLAHNWRTYLQTKLNTHVSNEARWGLGALAFLAVYREMFETALFYEALSLQVGPSGVQMVWLGIAVALAILIAIVIVMIRFGVRLPVQSFFRVSAWLIFLFAIVFIGQGIHGLEEAGKVPVWPVPVPTIALLGIYPNLFGLAWQAIVLVAAAWYARR